MKVISKNLPDFIFLILLTSTGLVPNFGALDRVATQWLYLNILNTVFLIYYLLDIKTKTNLSSILTYKPLIALSLFILWGLMSYFYSINGTEVIVKFIRWFQIPVSLFLLIIIADKNEFDLVKVISLIVSIILVIELYLTYSTYFDITKLTKYNFSLAYLLKGATGNKNINSASILVKLPFVFYLISHYKKILIKLILSILIFSSSYLIFIISARASLISFFLILIIISILSIYTFIKKKKLHELISSLLILGSMLFAFLIFQIDYRGNNTASITKRISTVNLEDKSTSQRVRFYNHSFTQIKENPFFGVGLGNWKIKSIDYDKENIEGYIVPYHVHNDFLEIGAELGLIGLGLYLFVIFYVLVSLYKKLLSRSFHISPINSETIIIFAGLVYCVDAALNFPHARPVMQIPFVLIIAITYSLVRIKNKVKDV